MKVIIDGKEINFPEEGDVFKASNYRSELHKEKYDVNTYNFAFHACYHWILYELFKQLNPEDDNEKD